MPMSFAEAVLEPTPTTVVPTGIRVVKANLGIVTAAGRDTAGDLLFAHCEKAGTDSTLLLHKMDADGTPLDDGAAARGVSVSAFPFLGLPGSSLGWGGSVFDASGNCLQAMS